MPTGKQTFRMKPQCSVCFTQHFVALLMMPCILLVRVFFFFFKPFGTDFEAGGSGASNGLKGILDVFDESIREAVYLLTNN